VLAHLVRAEGNRASLPAPQRTHHEVGIVFRNRSAAVKVRKF
jgi:hypothetical protein